jgi:hypothetical protein
MRRPTNCWRKKFRERALHSGLKYTRGARGPVIFRYPHRVRGIPLTLLEELKVPHSLYDWCGIMHEAANLATGIPTNVFGDSRPINGHTMTGATMMRHQAMARFKLLVRGKEKAKR